MQSATITLDKGGSDAGLFVSRRCADIFRDCRRLHLRVRPALGGWIMEIWLAGISALGLTVYLMFALLRPEQF